MPRQPLALGTWGAIRTRPSHHDKKGKPDRFRAFASYRGYDGRTRQYERSGRSAAAAENNLRVALKEMSRIARGGELTASHRFSVAAELWLSKLAGAVKEGSRSPGTVETYQRQLELHVRPALGELRLAEITTPIIDKFIGALKTDIGPATAKTCRSVVSGVMGLAVRYGAVAANPVREVERIEGASKREPRALTLEERTAWLAQLEADEDAVAKDLPDLSRFMLATGVRIGEALAVLWSEVDLDRAVVEITSTMIRVKGVGLLRKSTKSRAGERMLPLPTWAVAMLRRRFMADPHLDHPVFPDSIGGFRDPANTRRDLRNARGSDGFAWVTSHNFRKTAATILDEAGLTARLIADQLGHARPSMTQDIYMGRKAISPLAAAALEAVFAAPDENHG